jgi:DNA-directed RNA polymerase subunit N (RpoN/RPB10)
MSLTPPPLCFSCGNSLPITDYDNFHALVKEFVYTNISEDAAQKIILDSRLSKPYPRRCCRTMFLGDAIEYRNKMRLYDMSQLDVGVSYRRDV